MSIVNNFLILLDWVMEKKKKKQRDIIFFHFSYPRRTSSFFFFSPPFFRVFSTHSLFSYFLQIERNSTIPTDIRVCDRFFPRAFLLFFHCCVPLWIAAPPIYIYILNKDYPFVAREKFRGKIHDDWSNSMKKNSGRRGCLYIGRWKMG